MLKNVLLVDFELAGVVVGAGAVSYQNHICFPLGMGNKHLQINKSFVSHNLKLNSLPPNSLQSKRKNGFVTSSSRKSIINRWSFTVYVKKLQHF